MRSAFLSVVLVFLLIYLLSPVGAWAIEVDGVKIPETVNLEPGGTKLLLNGAGVRRKFFVKVYVGALYLPSRNKDADAILHMPGPKRMSLYFVCPEVSAKKIVESWQRGFSASLTPGELKRLEGRLAPFYRMFRKVYRGDEIRLDYLPGEGTRIWLNDETLCTVAGEDFYRAVLKVWLGPKAADKSLRRDMLGVS